jgi:undecaprenyl diphosphate synthase
MGMFPYSLKDLSALLQIQSSTIFTCFISIVLGFTIGTYYSRNGISKNSHNSPVDVLSEKQKQQLLSSKPEKIPKHIAVIMDGNRRFGREKHADPLQGHWAGGQRLVDFVQWCIEDGVAILTVYAFSTENWSRDAAEVKVLMTIFAKYAETFKHEALARNVKVNILSTDHEHLPLKVQKSVKELQDATASCTGFIVNICLSYGSRGEILDSCKKIGKCLLDGSLRLDEVSEDTITKHLQTGAYPDPDILIRTSGEYRLSNFILWQLAYTELFFIEKYWPQVSKLDLRLIFHQYCNRNRRFGL